MPCTSWLSKFHNGIPNGTGCLGKRRDEVGVDESRADSIDANVCMLHLILERRCLRKIDDPVSLNQNVTRKFDRQLELS